MRKVILFTNISLDGFIARTNGEIDWTIPDEELHRAAIDTLRDSDLCMFGRKTYQIMADYWPSAANNSTIPKYMVDFANALNPMKKIVFSKTLENAGWNTQILKEFDPEEIKRMKEEPGKDILIEGADIAQQFMQHDLIDGFRLVVHPVALGSGKPLFKQKMNLELIKSQVFKSGAVALYYLNRK